MAKTQKDSKKHSPLSKKPKQNVAALIREYGLPASYTKSSLRYTSPPEKGIYWYWFAKMRVLEDYIKYDGRCISCDRKFPIESLQGGHFVPAGGGGFTLLFHPLNVNAECQGCNGFDQMHLRGYERNLDKRYGAGTGEKLVQMKYSMTTKEWSAARYLEEAIVCRTRYEELKP